MIKKYMKMKRFQSITVMSVLTLMGVAGLTACSSSSEVDDIKDNPNVVTDDQGNAGVRPEFVISFPRSVVASTRMTDSETQSTGSAAQFRGMDHIRLIPFGTAPASTTPKFASIMALSSIASNALKKPGSLNYKVYADQFVPVNTTHFLFYGKAIDNTAEADITSMDDKFKFGSLKVTGLNDAEFTTPNSIIFKLEQINTSSEQQADNTVGRSVVGLMTSLANTTSTAGAPHNLWSTSTNKVLQGLYKNFIAATVSSSYCVSAMLGMIYDGLERVPASEVDARKLADDIKKKITDACSTTPVAGSPVQLKNDYAGYPANIGLPDGAARVRWDGTKFVDATANYGRKFKVKVTDYVYPAALWYYVNTALKSSESEQSGNYDSKTNWNEVISTFYSGAGTDTKVGPGTVSVALVDPVEYAVGRIETKIKMGSGVFYDGNGEEVSTAAGFKMKGLLFGGQNSVTYDFTSVGAENYVIYDRHLPDEDIIARTGSETGTANQTLALETLGNTPVYAALELVNGSEPFTGADGIIPAGGTFYLVVKLDPSTGTNYNATSMNQIVKKDHVTKLIVTIKNGSTTPPCHYTLDANGVPNGVDTGDGIHFDIDGNGELDTFITAANGGPGWDTDRDGIVDIPVLPDPKTGNYSTNVHIADGLGNATNGIPDLSSPGVELGTSVNLEWKEGLTLAPEI